MVEARFRRCILLGAGHQTSKFPGARRLVVAPCARRPPAGRPERSFWCPAMPLGTARSSTPGGTGGSRGLTGSPGPSAEVTGGTASRTLRVVNKYVAAAPGDQLLIRLAAALKADHFIFHGCTESRAGLGDELADSCERCRVRRWPPRWSCQCGARGQAGAALLDGVPWQDHWSSARKAEPWRKRRIEPRAQVTKPGYQPDVPRLSPPAHRRRTGVTSRPALRPPRHWPLLALGAFPSKPGGNVLIRSSSTICWSPPYFDG